MKKVYESPKMTAEAFETNAYCGRCDGQFELNGTLIVEPSSWGSKNNDPGHWSDTGRGEGLIPDNEETLSHTFVQANSVPMKDTWGNDQYFWRCSDGDGYYLEYSAHWTGENNRPTFFLYKEVNGTSGLQISGGTSWPLRNGSNDICVAQVVYQEGKNPIINS